MIIDITHLSMLANRLAAKNCTVGNKIKARLNRFHAQARGAIVLVILAVVLVVEIRQNTDETIQFLASWMSLPVWCLVVVSAVITAWEPENP